MRLAVVLVTLSVSLAYGGGISYGHWITAALGDVGVTTGSLNVSVEGPETEFAFACETHLFPRHGLSFVRFWAPGQEPGDLKPAIPGAVKIEEDGSVVSPGYSIDPPDAAIGDPVTVHLGSAVVTITDWIEDPGEAGEYLGFTYVLEGDPIVVDVKANRGLWRTTLETSGTWSLDGMCEPTARPLSFCQPTSIDSIIPVTNDGSVPTTPYIVLGPAAGCELFEATLETSSGVLASGPLCDLLDQPYQIVPQLDPGETALVTLSINVAGPQLEPGDYSANLTVTGFATQWNLPLVNADSGWTSASELPIDLTVSVEPPYYGYGDCDQEEDDKKGKRDSPVTTEGGEATDPVGDGVDQGAPAADTPAEESPAEQLPVEETPVDDPASEDPPVEAAPSDEPPVGEAPIDEPPAEEAPIDETLPEDPPADQPPADEPPADEPPAEDQPAEASATDNPPDFDVPRASLAGLVWHDIDGDDLKILGSPETGVAGVEVVLLDEDGLEVEVVETNTGGFYTFPDVEPGTYTVGFYPPEGYGFADIEEVVEPFDTPEDHEIFLAGLAEELGVEPEEIVISDLVSVDELSGPLIGLTAPVVLGDGKNLGIGDAAMIETPEPDQLEETPVAQTPAEPIEIPEPPAQPAESDEGDTSVSPANPDGDAREPEPDPVEETVVPDPDQPDSVGEDPDLSEPTGETVPPARAASEEPALDPGAESGPPAEGSDSGQPPIGPAENETTP